MQAQITKTDPFPSRGLDNYFFTTPALRLRLDLVQEYVRCNETPVLILGEPGVGKSTLLNQLVCHADHNWRVVRVPAVSSFSVSDIITFLNAELRLPARVPHEEMLASFDGWLARLAMRGQIAVVVVDNAHDLCDESLKRLATLQKEMKSKNLCVLMTGLPALRTRMSALLGTTCSLMPVHAINIPCLDHREVASYIDMRLYHAGLEGRGPFSRAIVDDIARSSRGYPGQINSLANGLLSGEQKKVRWQSASQRLRRIMGRWLTLALVTATVAISSIVAPGSFRIGSEGSAVAHASDLPVVRRSRRSENEGTPRSQPSMAARALVVLRGILPRMWGNGR
jgi:type II secretory pathway predicted ATPase ExeA